MSQSGSQASMLANEVKKEANTLSFEKSYYFSR